MITTKLLPRRIIKASQIPNEGFIGKLIDISFSLHGPLYIFEDELLNETAIYNCSALDRCLSHSHIGRHFKIIYKGQVLLPDGRKPFDIDVYEITNKEA